MTILDVIVLLIIAGVCGALGQAISGFSRGGCLVSIAIGFIGALLGMWLARLLGLPEQVRVLGSLANCSWSVLGRRAGRWRLLEHNVGKLPEPVPVSAPDAMAAPDAIADPGVVRAQGWARNRS